MLGWSSAAAARASRSRRALSSSFLSAFGDRLCHLHLQDPEPDADHWELGTGTNRPEDWLRLKEHLEGIDYGGAAVFEIRPRRPAATAARSVRFFEQA